MSRRKQSENRSGLRHLTAFSSDSFLALSCSASYAYSITRSTNTFAVRKYNNSFVKYAINDGGWLFPANDSYKFHTFNNLLFVDRSDWRTREVKPILVFDLRKFPPIDFLSEIPFELDESLAIGSFRILEKCHRGNDDSFFLYRDAHFMLHENELCVGLAAEHDFGSERSSVIWDMNFLDLDYLEKSGGLKISRQFSISYNRDPGGSVRTYILQHDENFITALSLNPWGCSFVVYNTPEDGDGHRPISHVRVVSDLNLFKIITPSKCHGKYIYFIWRDSRDVSVYSIYRFLPERLIELFQHNNILELPAGDFISLLEPELVKYFSLKSYPRWRKRIENNIPLLFFSRTIAHVSEAGLFIISASLSDSVRRDFRPNTREVLFVPFCDDWRQRVLTFEMRGICCAD